jgi:DNA-binding NarL/FixJ family response regulator
MDPTDASPRILVVDADDRTRESMVGILGIRHRYHVIGSAGHIAEALRLARAGSPDVVILDPRLPEVSDGMALIRRLRGMLPGVAILAVGWSPDLEHQALDAGADCFVRKTFKPGDLATAIGRCMDLRGPDAADLADVHAEIELAGSEIASLKGESPLVTITDSTGQASAEPVVAARRIPATPSTESTTRSVRAPGTGLIL